VTVRGRRGKDNRKPSNQSKRRDNNGKNITFGVKNQSGRDETDKYHCRRERGGGGSVSNLDP
jgi:hypothetical protein